MEVFKSRNGESYQVLDYATCPQHGKYISRARHWTGTFVDGFQAFESPVQWCCPRCAAESKDRARFGQVAIPPRFFGKTIRGYVAETAEAKQVKAFFQDYADHLKEYISVGRSIVLVGQPGTGKTHLACALLAEAKRAGFGGLFTTVQKVVRAVRDTWGGSGNESEVIQNFSTVRLLAIDEIGVQAGSDNEKQILFAILNERYERLLPTILISNLDLNGIKEAIGARVFDRLREGGGRAFVFNWKSYRARAAAPTMESTQNMLPSIEEVPDDAKHQTIIQIDSGRDTRWELHGMTTGFQTIGQILRG